MLLPPLPEVQKDAALISGSRSRWWHDAAAAGAELYSRRHIAALSPLYVCKACAEHMRLVGFASEHCSDMLSNVIRARKLARICIELKCMHCSGQIEHEIAPQASNLFSATQNTCGGFSASPLSSLFYLCTSLPVAQARRLHRITSFANQQADCPNTLKSSQN